MGVGSSNGASATTLDAAANLRLTKKTQALNFDLGPAYVHWLGRSLVTLRAAPGFGLERYDSVLFVDLALRGALGAGLVVGERTRELRHWSVLPEMEGVMDEGWMSLRRERTVLTLELTGAVEVLGARPVLLTAGVLVGISWFDETFTGERSRQPGPWWLHQR
jgi:hypothetical protein